MSKNIIHGDVDLITINQIPETAKLVKPDLKNINERGFAIELGEHSGHAHCISPTIGGVVNVYFDDLTETQYVQVQEAPAVITHEEHAPLIIPIGIYKKAIEKEYDPFLKIIKQVVD